MESSDILESRLAEIEEIVYGIERKSETDIPESKNTLLEDLHHANTLISSALSGREKTNILVNRLPELNELLEASNEDILQPQAKFEIIQSREPEIRKNLELMNQINELSSSLETDNLKDVPELIPKLEGLNVEYLRLYEESNDFDSSIREMLTTYSEIMESISGFMVSFDAQITAAELAAKTKKKDDSKPKEES